MRALVVYESMYGNTHLIAEAIAEGLSSRFDDVLVRPVGEVDQPTVDWCDLLVIGGPTHVHTMSSPRTRDQAVMQATTGAHADELDLDPDAEGPGMREWFETVRGGGTHAAAFDTRVDIAPILSGRASKAISKKLRHTGFAELVDPESFLVSKATQLQPGEIEHASNWGRRVANFANPDLYVAGGRADGRP